MSEASRLTFDVMLRGRFVRRLSLPLRPSGGRGGGRAAFRLETLERLAEDRIPALKGKPYKILF